MEPLRGPPPAGSRPDLGLGQPDIVIRPPVTKTRSMDDVYQVPAGSPGGGFARVGRVHSIGPTDETGTGGQNVSVSPSLRLCLSVSLSLSVSPSLCLSVSLSVSLCLCLAVSLSLPLLPLSLSPSLPLSLSPSLPLSLSPSLPLSLSPSLPLSLSPSGEELTAAEAPQHPLWVTASSLIRGCLFGRPRARRCRYLVVKPVESCADR